MHLSKPVGWLATLLVVVASVGAAVALVTGSFLGEFALASVVVVLVVAAAVAVASVRGARSREWLSNGGYW